MTDTSQNDYSETSALWSGFQETDSEQPEVVESDATGPVTEQQLTFSLTYGGQPLRADDYFNDGHPDDGSNCDGAEIGQPAEASEHTDVFNSLEPSKEPEIVETVETFSPSGEDRNTDDGRKASYSDAFGLFQGSTQGYSHIKAGMACEDSGAIRGKPGEFKMFVVADGHGDSNCPRSKFGSQAACDVTIKKLTEFYQSIKESHWEKHIVSEDPKMREKIARQLIVSIVSEWSQVVNSDFAARPLTPEERTGCSRYIERYDKGQRIEHIYGTTLIAGLLTDSYLLLLQQGDGKCVVFDSKGDASEPIPWDPRCNDNITTSLCDEDVVQGFRHCEIDVKTNPIIACVAGSDGVDDSFPNSGLMYAHYRQILSDAAEETGAQSLMLYLEKELPNFSKNGSPQYSGAGSQDDVTIVGFADFNKLKQFRDKFMLDNEIVLTEMEIANVAARIASKNGMGKYDALKDNQNKHSEILQEARKKLSAAVYEQQEFQRILSGITRSRSEETSMVRNFYRKYFMFDEMAAAEKKNEEFNASVRAAELNVKKAEEAFERSRKEFDDFDSSINVLEQRKHKAEEKLAQLKKKKSV